ncbi:MAG: hypothetical protein U0Q11_18555 [Vicinamibacterales bacterium]
MRQGIRQVLLVSAAAATAALVALLVAPVSGQQATAYRAPRAADGHPDLNGIWQAMNEANWDIEMHMARPALQTRPGPYGPVPAPPVLAMGAAGAVPPGVGVVEGELPHKPEEALTQRNKNREN